MNSGDLLGVEIGATKLQIVAGNADVGILRRERRMVERSRGAEGIREQIEAVIATWRRNMEWQAAGAGFGGPVDVAQGRVANSCHIAGWEGFPLGEWLAELCGAPAIVENDTNAAALAEAVCGAGRGGEIVFYTNSGSGVGGGLVVRGEIYHATPPGEAEFGHLRLDKAGTIVEDRCSGWALDRRVQEAIARGDSILSELASRGGGDARQLGPALAAGDRIAVEIVEGAADDLAFALSHVVHLFHPTRIVLGGGVSLIGEPWRAAVANALPRYMMAPFHPGPDVRLAELGEDVVPVGALLCARGLLSADCAPSAECIAY